MQAVDVAARQRFREIDDPRISRAADDQPYWTEGLTRAATEQRAWVAVDDLGAVIGFAVAWVVDGEGHLDELAVTPAHGRRGVGRALVDEVLAWSAARGLPSVTLITFRDVPWNGPYYERIGFSELKPQPETQLASLFDAEAEDFDPATRVAMRRRIARPR